ncbi:MAG: transposase [Gammaproteobacteria bacterium]|nr:transposase [Gammaproteobacteria bacterium]
MGEGLRPAVIQMDNVPEFSSRVLDRWAYNQEVKLQFIRPCKSTDNGHIQNFNARLRYECLNHHVHLESGETREPSRTGDKITTGNGLTAPCEA